MKKNKGFTLVELVVVIAILAVLTAIFVPQYIQYAEKARQTQVEQEAAAINRAAVIAVTRSIAHNYVNNGFNNVKIKNEVNAVSSFAPADTPFKKNASCGRLTNFWLGDAGQTELKKAETSEKRNALTAKEFVSVLGFEKSGSKASSIPISKTVPGNNKINLSDETDGEAVFQVFFNEQCHIATEYYRNGYFVRIEDGETKTWRVSDGGKVFFTLASVSS